MRPALFRAPAPLGLVSTCLLVTAAACATPENPGRAIPGCSPRRRRPHRLRTPGPAVSRQRPPVPVPARELRGGLPRWFGGRSPKTVLGDPGTGPTFPSSDESLGHDDPADPPRLRGAGSARPRRRRGQGRGRGHSWPPRSRTAPGPRCSGRARADPGDMGRPRACAAEGRGAAGPVPRPRPPPRPDTHSPASRVRVRLPLTPLTGVRPPPCSRRGRAPGAPHAWEDVLPRWGARALASSLTRGTESDLADGHCLRSHRGAWPARSRD